MRFSFTHAVIVGVTLLVSLCPDHLASAQEFSLTTADPGSVTTSSPPVLSEIADLSLDPLQKEVSSEADKQNRLPNFLGTLDPKTKKSVAKMVGGLAVVVAMFLAFVTLFGKKRHHHK